MCIIVRVRVKLIAVAEKYHNDRFRIFITASYIVHSTRCNGIWVKVSNWQITEYQVRLVVSEQHKETNTSQTIQSIFIAHHPICLKTNLSFICFDLSVLSVVSVHFGFIHWIMHCAYLHRWQHFSFHLEWKHHRMPLQYNQNNNNDSTKLDVWQINTHKKRVILDGERIKMKNI